MDIPRRATINVIKSNEDDRSGKECRDNYQNADRQTSNVIFDVLCQSSPRLSPKPLGVVHSPRRAPTHLTAAAASRVPTQAYRVLPAPEPRSAV
jgi:hypothetical protein